LATLALIASFVDNSFAFFIATFAYFVGSTRRPGGNLKQISIVRVLINAKRWPDIRFRGEADSGR
jgi:hypothetical protein